MNIQELFLKDKNLCLEKAGVSKHNDYDSAWKEILDVYFMQFIAYFYPELEKEIDWKKGYTSLDKELNSIYSPPHMQKRMVDKLIKVKSLQGEEQWVFIHIEIQNQRQKHFEQRMFEYYYRLHERYHKPIINLVILTDVHDSWRPHCYQSTVWKKDILRFNFFPVKLLDYQQGRSLDPLNPFSIVIEAHFAALATRRNPQERFSYKFRLTKALYERGFKKTDILVLYRFIDWILTLQDDLALKYQDAIFKLEGEKNMRYITQGERLSLKKGFEQGIQKGLQDGIQKGLQDGIQKGLQEGIQKGVKQGEYFLLQQQLKTKFHHIPSHYQERLKQADANTLLKWGKQILTAHTLDELFQ